MATGAKSVYPTALPHCWLESYISSDPSRSFPFVNPRYFESTISAAYHQELSVYSPSVYNVKACVFAFIAVSSTLVSEADKQRTVNADNFAWHRLLRIFFTIQ
ncbi:hypothetical protein BBP40_002220 [Aspergillus hancockii]|nr:hypothetical protein BBP40_002220 [Aspergillus hancockii]